MLFAYVTCRRRRRLAAVCLLALPLLALAGAQPAQARSKTLVYCSEGSPEGFNPQLFTSGTTFNASSRPLYNRLLEFEPGTTALVPGLAESWTISPDGLAYTFSLRRNVAFHAIPGFTPSRPFNADDVLFSFARQWRPEHPYHEVSGGKYTFFTSIGMGKRLKSIEKVDEHTVRFILHQPDVPFLAELAMDFASILSSEYAYAMLKAGTPEKVDTQPVGTGPFILTDYRKDETIRYKAHPQAWQGRPRLDQLVFAITPDPSARHAKLRDGECHVAPYPNPADLPAMRENRRLRVIEQEGLDLSYLALNTEKPPLDDPRVRQAINLAVDRAAIVQAVYQGAARPARNPLPPVVWGYNNEIPPYPHDPERARQLLAEAGRGGGFAIDLWAMPVSRPYLPNGRKMAEMVQRDLDAIGIKAGIVTYEWADYLKRLRAGEHSIATTGWTGDSGDPDNFLHLLLSCDAIASGTNRARWCHAPYDALITEAGRATDFGYRAELYRRAQVVAREQAPIVPIAHSVVAVAVRREVRNFRIGPTGQHMFHAVELR